MSERDDVGHTPGTPVPPYIRIAVDTIHASKTPREHLEFIQDVLRQLQAAYGWHLARLGMTATIVEANNE